MNIHELAVQVQAILPNEDIQTNLVSHSKMAGIRCKPDLVPRVCEWLFGQQYHFAGMVVEENASQWDLFYIFVGDGEKGCIRVTTSAPLENTKFQSVSMLIHAADWHEREAEDLFGLTFEGHPRLGDFILHDDAWQEGVEPMRKAFDSAAALSNRKPNPDWEPRRVLNAPGAFIMPIGPVFAGSAESVHFQLETIGEEVVRAFPRLFFKYRGVEKSAEGRTIDDALLLAERFAGKTAFSHALAFCLAVEQLSDAQVPERAQILRVFFAELERLRSHLGTIEGICNATGLVVAANQVVILEEEMLRLTGLLVGHRYFFGLAIPGGLSLDCDGNTCRDAVSKAGLVIRRLDKIEGLLTNTSSFLDRLEQVGMIDQKQAREYALVGPVARGTGYCNDLRAMRPYTKYEEFEFQPACEQEGDGYARLRVLFEEARQSVHIMEQAVAKLPDGPIFSSGKVAPGMALAGVETPRGATWHWVHIDENARLTRYRLITPSFTNWHGFHMAAEHFAFQDFPIIMATFGLSVAENDR